MFFPDGDIARFGEAKLLTEEPNSRAMANKLRLRKGQIDRGRGFILMPCSMPAYAAV